jgi:ABC-type amino acid transport substrate-binding protein
MHFCLEPWRGGRGRTAAALLFMAAASVVASLSAQTKPLALVSTSWSPFTNVPGQPRFALDLVESAFGRIGVGSKTTIVGAAQFTPSLLTGQFDGSAAAWKDPERERVLLFSKPYLENRLVLIARRGGDAVAFLDAQRGESGDARRARQVAPIDVALCDMRFGVPEAIPNQR